MHIGCKCFPISAHVDVSFSLEEGNVLSTREVVIKGILKSIHLGDRFQKHLRDDRFRCLCVGGRKFKYLQTTWELNSNPVQKFHFSSP